MMIVGDDFCYDVIGEVPEGIIVQFEENGKIKQKVLSYKNSKMSIDVKGGYKDEK